MKYLSKKYYFRFLTFILIITTFLPVLIRNMPPVIRSHHLWAVIWILSLITLFPEVFKNKLFIYVLFYQIVFMLLVFAGFWYSIDDWTIKAINYDFYYFSIAFSLITYYRCSLDYQGLAFNIKWAIIFTGITALMSIYSSFIDPLYARKITGGDFEVMDEIFKYGGGTYGYAAALVCLFPIIVYYYKYNTDIIFSKKQIFIFGIICFFALIRIQIFANILVASIVIFFSVFGRNNLKRSLLISTSLFGIIIATPGETKANLMNEPSGYFSEGSENRKKFKDLNEYLYTDDQSTMTASRVERYPLLWKDFVTNPFLGHFFHDKNNKIGPGAHLYFMYKLTGFGLLNFILFLLIFTKHLKFNLEFFSEGYTFYFILSVFSILVLGLMKNLTGRELWYMYFFIVPGLYYLPFLKQERIRKDISSV